MEYADYKSIWTGPEIDGRLGMVSGRNLLDNWYFADPINQRGQTTYSSAGYTIDRWFSDTGTTLLLDNEGIFFSSDALWRSLAQKLEPFLARGLLGRRVTFSLLARISNSDTLRMLLYSYNNKIEAEKTFPGTGEVELYSTTGIITNVLDLNSFGALIGGILSNSSYLIAAKLELGDTQTLARQENGVWVLNDPPPNKTLELAKCQRYFYRFIGDFFTYSIPSNSSTCYGTAWLPVPMRVHPAVSNIKYATDHAKPEATNWRGSLDSILFQSPASEAQILGFDASADL